MITLQVKQSDNGAQDYLLSLKRELENPRALSAALGSRLEDELVEHFEKKDKTPNKLGGERTHLWRDIDRATQLRDIRDNSATVAIANGRFATHLFGGVVRPKKATYLTIPMAPEAHGRRASVLESALGIDLFVAETSSGSLWLASEKGEDEIEFWYLLTRSAKIPKDPVIYKLAGGACAIQFFLRYKWQSWGMGGRFSVGLGFLGEWVSLGGEVGIGFGA